MLRVWNIGKELDARLDCKALVVVSVVNRAEAATSLVVDKVAVTGAGSTVINNVLSGADEPVIWDVDCVDIELNRDLELAVAVVVEVYDVGRPTHQFSDLNGILAISVREQRCPPALCDGDHHLYGLDIVSTINYLRTNY